MQLESFYSVLMTENVGHLSKFYQEVFGFELSFETDWYVSLKTPGEEHYFQLALLQPGHPTIPEGFSRPAQGVILNFEVEDATAEYARLVENGKRAPLLALKDEGFGQRHFIVQDPDGNLIDVIENIPPSEEFVAAYDVE